MKESVLDNEVVRWKINNPNYFDKLPGQAHDANTQKTTLQKSLPSVYITGIHSATVNTD